MSANSEESNLFNSIAFFHGDKVYFKFFSLASKSSRNEKSVLVTFSFFFITY